MFCVKCGKEIESSDIYCLKCGAINENYRPIKKKIRLKNFKTKYELKLKKSVFSFIIPVIIIFIIICLFATIYVGITKKRKNMSIIKQSNGISAIIDKDWSANFFINNQTITFKGEYSNGISSPDHNKFVLLNFDGTLEYYESKDAKPLVIASNVERIIKITNDGCVFAVNDKIATEDIISKMSASYKIDKSFNELIKEFNKTYENSVSEAKKFYITRMGYTYTSNNDTNIINIYKFKSGDLIKTQNSSQNMVFSDSSLTFAYINANKKLLVYITGTDSVKELCNVGDNATLCGISSDGQKIIWAEEKDNELIIYMMKNNVPERIGKLGKTQKYSSYPNVVFFDKGFIVSCKEYNTIVFAKNDTIKEVTFGGVMDLYRILDDNGNSIENSPCKANFFYFTARKSKDGNISRLYKLNMNGNIEEVMSDLSSQYFIRKNKLFYVNNDNDFYVCDITQKGITNLNCVTTEISQLNISNDGETAYVVKANELYYWDTNDTSYKLHKICDTFENDSKIFLTEDETAIFYLIDMQYITDSYNKIGTLYYYKKDTSIPQEIATNVYTLKSNDPQNYLSTNPIIVQYSKKNTYNDELFNIGLLNNNKLKVIIKDVTNY